METGTLELTGDGYGYGYGSGDGSGYGYGYGSGDGSGDGYGYGYGYGDGDGYGYGYGSGYGSGDGYGDGYGSGDGSGDGSGSDTQGYLDALFPDYKKVGAIVAFWRSHEDGTPANGGSGTVAKVGLVEEIPGPLQICTRWALHATNAPGNWKGRRLWIVALHAPVQQQDDKFGSLKRTFLADLGLYEN